MDNQKKLERYKNIVQKNHLTEKHLKVYSNLFLALAIIAFIIGIPTITFGGIFFIIIGILAICFSNLYRNCTKACFKHDAPVDLNNNTYTKPESQIFINNDNSTVLNQVKVEIPTTLSTKSNEDNTKKLKKENHRVAGITHYENEVLSLSLENDDYDCTKKDLIEFGMTDERIYQYVFPVSEVELIEEPDNEHDPNAIKVLVNGKQIGYIKSGSCGHVKKLIKEDKIEDVKAFIGGGKYKYLAEDYDYEKDKAVYNLEKGSTNYFCEITLILK